MISDASDLSKFTDVLMDVIPDSPPISLPSSSDTIIVENVHNTGQLAKTDSTRPSQGTGPLGEFRNINEIDPKYRHVFTYPYFNLVQSKVIDAALYSDNSMVVCAPTGSGKTVVFEMAIIQLLMEIEKKKYTEDFKIIYMAPVKALCTERLTEWYPKFTKLGLMCIEVTGDTDVDFSQLSPYKIIITTPEKWDILTRRWKDHRGLVELVKLFLIDEVHILNDEARGPVLEAVVSRMKTIESSAQSAYRIEQLQKQYQVQNYQESNQREHPAKIRFVAVSATVNNPEDVAEWLGTSNKPAVYYKFGDECRPVKLKRIVEGYPCQEGSSIFKFDIMLNYKLWPIIQKYYNGKPTLIFCNTRKSVTLTAEALSREITINFNAEQKAKLTALATTIKNKKLQALVLNGVGCHHAGLLYEERFNIEQAFRNRELPILITTTTLAMGVNLPAHLVIIKNTQQYVNGAYQEYSISTVLQMIGRAGRPQFDTEATAVIMTRLCDKLRYQALVGGNEPLQSYLHKRLAENLNSEAALGTVGDVAQCVQWLLSTFLYVRASKDPKRYLGLSPGAPSHLICKKIEELCVKAMNGLATSGLITMDDASCIASTEAGRLMSVFYLDLETMKLIMKIEGNASLEALLWVICESHELSDMHLRVDERRCLNTLNRNNAAATIRFPMKGKINTRQMKLNCIIQAILGCLPIPDPALHQEAMKIMRIAERICKCMVTYVTRPNLISKQPAYFSAILNSIILSKCIATHLWENSPYVSKQLKGIGPTFSTLLASAGKVNFLLLEESHPRDLERIMNKGPPTGNAIRKQISLLPKYQVEMTPVDESTVTLKIILLNQAFLSENMENLTAGEKHKCYVIVGDSENHLLLLTSFKDRDLINIFEGNLTHRIERKHDFEHKIFVHCISTEYVGIDANCQYLFKSLVPMKNYENVNEDPKIKFQKKHLSVKAAIKERKRKCNSVSDLTQCKEKKKRDNALIEKIKFLKESFGTTSKEIKQELQKSTDISNQMLHILTGTNNSDLSKSVCEENLSRQVVNNVIDIEEPIDEINNEKIDEELVNSEYVNNILNEIENEIDKSKRQNNSKSVGFSFIDFSVKNPTKNEKDKKTPYPKLQSHSPKKFISRASIINKKNEQKKVIKHCKSNYEYIELLKKNESFSDDKVASLPEVSCGFTNAIKSSLEKYLQQTENTIKVQDLTTTELLKESQEFTEKPVANFELMTLNDEQDFFKHQNNNDDVIRHEEYKLKKEQDKNVEKHTESSNQETKEVLKPNVLLDISNKQNLDIMTAMSRTSISGRNFPDTNIVGIEYERIVKGKENNNLISQNGTIMLQTESCSTIKSKSYPLGNDTAKNMAKRTTNIHTADCEPPNNYIFKDTFFLPQNNEAIKRDSMKASFEFPSDTIRACSPTKSISNPSKIGDDKNMVIIRNKYKIVDFKPKNNYICENATFFIQNREKDSLSTFKSPKKNKHIGMNSNVHCKDMTALQTLDSDLQSSMNTAISVPDKAKKTSAFRIGQLPKINFADEAFGDKFFQNSEFIRKYSFTSSKIDVTTKHTPEHKVHVIKKLTLDLDVTEIRCKKYDNTDKDKKPNNHKTCSKKLNSFTLQTNYSNNFPNNTLISLTNEVQLYDETQDIDKESIVAPNMSDSTRKSNSQVRDLLPFESDYCKETTVTVSREHDNSFFRTSISSHKKDMELPSQKVLTNQIRMKQMNESNNSVNDCSKENNYKSVTALLQKYSSILGKNTTNNQISEINYERTFKENKSSITQSKREKINKKKPFNITNLSQVEISLPNILTNESFRSVKTDVFTRDSNRESESMQKKQDKFAVEYKAIDKSPEIEPITDEILERLSPENCTESAENSDYEINQSMFNPRILLESFTKGDSDDSIIPPPAQFSDQFNTPPKSQNNLNVIDLTTRDYLAIQHSDFKNKISSGDSEKSIFEEDDLVLTPSKEIETWTLPQEDPTVKENDFPLYNFFEPFINKSFTAMRNNNDNNASPMKTYNKFTRNAILKKFKFQTKNKFKKM